MIGRIHPDVLLHSLVHAFRLSVRFRVMTGGEVQLHVEEFSERPEEGRDKLGAPVAGDMAGDSVLGEDVNEEEPGEFRRVDMSVARYKNDLFGCAINND